MTAVFSPDRTWRYELRRFLWPGGPVVAFIGLNPSTADEIQDDPTIRRCKSFALREGFGELVMVNLFAFRATDPAVMRAAPDPVGPDNDDTLRRVYEEAELTIAAWGVHGTYLDRDRQVRRMLGPLHALGLTKDGHPRHPLYLPGTAPLMELAA